jgi:tRNA A-37 threonylcarbamoyl transferase component Bud32
MYPLHAAELRELLPAVALMEQVKGRKTLQSAPDQIGEYHILREIGRGGMGIVYEAEQPALGRHVAIKIAPAHVHLEPIRLERFRREAQAAARLHHSNIVPVFGVGESQGLHYFVMQYIGGCGLNEIIAAIRKQPGTHGVLQRYKNIIPPPPTSHSSTYFQWVAQIGVQVADALSYAHTQGTLHRDIKPGNIILDAHGTAWVADFGLAKLSDQDDLTATGDILGTLQYIAPEALQGKGDVRSDVYGLALTLYEMVTLKAPYHGFATLELLKVIAEQDPVRPSQIMPHIPADLETIILKGSTRNPKDRYSSAQELAADLRRFLDDRPIAARPVSKTERAVRWCRRNRALSVLGLTAGASLLGALIVGWTSYVSTREALFRESQRRQEADIAKEQADVARLRAEGEYRRAETNMRLSLRAIEDLFASVGRGDSLLPLPPDPDLNGPPNGHPPPPPPPTLPLDAKDFREPRDPRERHTGPERPDRPDRPDRRSPPEQKENAALLQSILKFYERFASENQTDGELQFEATRAQLRVGDLQMRSGEESKAEEAFRKALLMTEKMNSEKKKQPEYSSFQAQAHFGLGCIRQRSQKVIEAETYFRRSLEYQQKAVQLRSNTNDIEQQLFLNVIRHNLALTIFDQDQTKEARILCKTSVAELEPLQKAKTSPRTSAALALHYRLLMRMEEDAGNPREADTFRRLLDAMGVGPNNNLGQGPGRRPDNAPPPPPLRRPRPDFEPEENK